MNDKLKALALIESEIASIVKHCDDVGKLAENCAVVIYNTVWNEAIEAGR